MARARFQLVQYNKDGQRYSATALPADDEAHAIRMSRLVQTHGNNFFIEEVESKQVIFGKKPGQRDSLRIVRAS